MYRLLTIFCFFALFSCKNGSKTTASKNTEPTAPTAAASQTQTIPTTNGDQAPVEIDLSKVPPVSASKKAYLTTNFWSCFGAQHPNDDGISGQYTNVKLQFLPDMTFKMYRNKSFVFDGKWAYDDAKKEIYLASIDQFYNTSFKTIDNGMRMVWIGNTDLNKMGVQMRWDNHQKLED